MAASKETDFIKSAVKVYESISAMWGNPTLLATRQKYLPKNYSPESSVQLKWEM